MLKDSDPMIILKHKIGFHSLLFLFFYFTWFLPVAADFNSEQRRYPRVQTAYKEKFETIKDRLAQAGLQLNRLEIFLRIFKWEQVVEIWGRNPKDLRFRPITQYPICSTSGSLGPKRREGDNQIPEGFYHINRFNPWSLFYLSMQINYPNRSDRILGDPIRPGGTIFIHGSCVTIGCIPITDDKIKELYILALEAHSQGQDRIPVHVFPMRLNPENMAKLAENFSDRPERLAFWQNIKPGFDYFESKKKLPRIRVQPNGLYQIE